MRNVGKRILYLGQELELNLTRISQWTFISGITSGELIVAVKFHVEKASEAISGPRGKIWEKCPLVKPARGRDKREQRYKGWQFGLNDTSKFFPALRLRFWPDLWVSGLNEDTWLEPVVTCLQSAHHRQGSWPHLDNKNHSLFHNGFNCL